MRNVLVVAKDLQLHGITSVIMSYFRALDRNLIRIDFAVGSPVDRDLLREIRAAGSQVELLPPKSEQPMGYYAGIDRAMKKKQYDILHVHGNSAVIGAELLLGLRNHIPYRIAHSHNSMCNHVWMHRLLRPFFSHTYTKGLACSELAGTWMFGKRPFQVLQNGLDTHKYVFRDADRAEIRTEYGLKNSYVVGHIGCFNRQKNHTRIVDIFCALKAKLPSAKLLLVGDGGTREEIENRVAALHLEQDVIFAGTKQNIPQLLAAMDCFLLPSLHEGLSVVLLEAQISGLPCILSDVCSSEAKLGEHYIPVSLDAPDAAWVQAICENPVEPADRRSFYAAHRDAVERFEITKTVRELTNLYCGRQK